MTVKIDTDAEINKIRMKVQTSTPASPASGYEWFYGREDGLPYFENSTGTVILIFS